MLKSSTAITFSYLIIYFFKERIQIISIKWPVNTKTCLQFLDYRKFWAHPFTYFILTLLNFRLTAKFYKSMQPFVQFVTFNDLKFKLEMMNIMLQMMNIMVKIHERKRKKFSVFFSSNISCHETIHARGYCHEKWAACYIWG